ncbi:hypothetical protein ACFLXH_04875 [Chloroflexota bacterium]
MLNNEKGQALPLVLIALAIGTMVVTPFLSHAGTGIIASRLYGQAIDEQYADDSGVEHGIWRLMDDNLIDSLTSLGDSVSYNLSESVNGVTVNITVANSWETIAGDDFESGGWAGGTGWLDAWYYEGNASVVTTDNPYEGSYHLQLTDSTGYAKRSVDVQGPGANLQFWAKGWGWDAGEGAQCLISPNGTDWTAVYTWVDGDDDDTYRFYDIDLSSYALTSEFWIAFDSNASATNEYFWVDDLKVLWVFDTEASVASDDFESGNWTGGSGWLADWAPAGEASVVTSDSPYEGSYHLQLLSSDGYANRSVDLSAESSARLQFWAKARGWDNGEGAQCLVSENGTDWTAAYTWVNGDDDNNYHYYDIDLSSYTLTSEFWIAFDSNASATNEYFWIDDLQIKRSPRYGIIARAGDGITKAVVKIEAGVHSPIDWWMK